MHSTQATKKTVVIGIDLAKTHCDAVGYGEDRQITFKMRNASYAKLFEKLADMPSASVLMEACAGSHYIIRKVIALGHDGKLVNPADVRSIRGNKQKNNLLDCTYIAQAYYLLDTKYVAPKTLEQQELQAMERMYEGDVQARVELGNRLHATLLEFGHPVEKSVRKTEVFFMSELLSYLDGEWRDLSPRAKEIIIALRSRWLQAKAREKESKERLEAWIKSLPSAKRLMTIPGIGPKIAGAFIVHCGDATRFKNSRQCAASIGLVPSQYSTGSKDTLGHITKRGPKGLRSLLVEGAAALMIHADSQKGKLGEWIRKIKATGKKYGVKVCALANKLARIAWRILRDEDAVYQPVPQKAKATA